MMVVNPLSQLRYALHRKYVALCTIITSVGVSGGGMADEISTS